MTEKVYSGSFRRRVQRIRENGLRWFLHRIAIELSSPSRATGQLINPMLRRLSRLRAGDRSPAAGDTLLVVYDLLVEPNTFDFLWFLMVADLRRQDLGLAGMHVMIVGCLPGERRKEGAEYATVVSDSAWFNRITNILVPLCWAVPSVHSVSILHDRREVSSRLASWLPSNIFPDDYVVDFYPTRSCDWPRYILERSASRGDVRGIFRATDAGLDYVDRWLEGRGATGKIVSITIRFYDYNPLRNSNVREWAAFARYLVDGGYVPVFIPDTESLAHGHLPEISEFLHFDEAAWNLDLRIATYERSLVNFGINNGPAFLFLVDERAKGVMCKIVTHGVEQNEEAYLRKQGFEMGGQIPFCSSFQKRVWEDDDFPTLRREFEAMEPHFRREGAA